MGNEEICINEITFMQYIFLNFGIQISVVLFVDAAKISRKGRYGWLDRTHHRLG